MEIKSKQQNEEFDFESNYINNDIHLSLKFIAKYSSLIKVQMFINDLLKQFKKENEKECNQLKELLK